MNKKNAPFFVVLVLFAAGAWIFLRSGLDSPPKGSERTQVEDAPGSNASEEEKSPAPKEPLAPLDPQTVGSIRGRVFFDGAPPARGKVNMAGTAECIALHKELPEAEKVVVEDGKLQNVVVFVRKGAEGRKFDPPSEPVVMDQVGCVYIPHVLSMQTGQELKVLNSDPLAHNVWPDSIAQNWDNLMMPRKGSELLYKARKAEITSLRCGVHSWMKSYVAIFNHPFHVVTGKDGAFALEGLPPGKYTIRAWHEDLGTKDQEVTLEPKGQATLDFRFASK